MIASRELDRKQFFQPIVETISLTLKLPVSIWLADETGEALRIAAATELPDDYIRKAVLRLDELSVASDVFATGQTVVVTDISSDDRWKYKPEAAAMGLKSAIVVPLRVKKKIVGVLDVYAYEVRDFSDSEKVLIERLAAQAALTQRRIRDLATLNEVSLLISSELHSADLFRHIMQAAERVLDCNHVSVFLTDKSGDLALKAASSAGIARERFAPGEGLAGWVAQTKRSELVPDAVNHPQFVPGLSSDLIERSMLVVPMTLEDRVIGVISADMDGLRGFDEHDQTLLEALASQAAVAVRNARLLEQATNRATALQRLHQIGGQVLSAELSVHGLREVLRQVARNARSVLGADLVDVYQYVEAEDRYVLPPVLEGERRDLTVPRVPKRIFDDDVVVRVVEGGEPLYSPDAQTAPLLSSSFTVERPERPERRFVVREGILSSAAVPLKAAGETVGVMFVNYRTLQDFSSGQREIIELFANQAAMAIYNARVYEQIQARDERLRTLVKVGQALTSEIHLPQDEILESIYEQARWLTGTQDMYIALYDGKSNMINFGLAMESGKRAKVGVGGWAPREANLEERGKTEEIILAKEPILHRTLEESTKWYKEPGHKEFLGRVATSWMGVPMVLGDRVLGVIAIYDWEREYAYNKQDLQVFSSMANQAAIALDNARLYYDVNQRLEDTNQRLEDANRGLERRVEALAALNEVGQTLTSGIRLNQDAILELIYEQAQKLTGAQDMYIALYDEETRMIRFGMATEHGERVHYEPRKADMEKRGKTEEVIFARSPILHRTLAESEAWYGQPGHQEFIGRVQSSYLGVPVVVGEKVLGMVAIYDWEREHAYDEQDLQIFSSMASQAAIALDNAALYQRVEKHSGQLETVRKVANAITAELDPQVCMERILDETIKLLDANYATIQLVDEATNELVIHAQRGMEGRRLASEMQRIKIGEGVTGLVAQNKWTIRLGNVEEVEYYLDYVVEGTRSEMATPLIEQGKVIGVINVEDTRENAFDQDDEELFELLAEEVVIAIQNARKVEASREEQERRAEAERFQYLGLLAGGVAHRVGSKGGLIRLHVNNLRKLMPEEKDDVYAILDKIERDNDYLIELSDALFKPAEAAETPVGPVNVNQLLRRSIRGASIPPEVELSLQLADVPLINGNRFLVDVFVELISNAIRAMSGREEKKLVVCSQLVDSSNVAVICEDTGCGIAPEEMSKIFDLFYTRGKGVPTPSRGGYGLWYSKSIVTRMGGDLRIESEVGKGTKCTVLLPVTSPAAC